MPIGIIEDSNIDNRLIEDIMVIKMKNNSAQRERMDPLNLSFQCNVCN